MIKLTLETEDKDKPIVQQVKAVAVPAFTRMGFVVVQEKHTAKEIKAYLKKWNVKFDEKATLEQLVKLL